MRNWIKLFESGEHRVAYHGSNAPIDLPFRAFTHFGTAKAAINRAAVVAHKATNTWSKEKGFHSDHEAPLYIYEVSLAIRNPLRIADLSGKFSNHDFPDLWKLLPFKRAEKSHVYNFTDVADLLREKGFDGLVYENLHEDQGEDSFIILSEEQVLNVSQPTVMTLAQAAKMLGVELA